MLENPCLLTWILTWILLSNPGVIRCNRMRNKTWIADALIKSKWCIYASMNKLTTGSDNDMAPAGAKPIPEQKWCLTLNCTMRSKLQWNFSQNKNISFQKSAFENVIKVSAILFKRQCIKHQVRQAVNGAINRIVWTGEHSILLLDATEPFHQCCYNQVTTVVISGAP